MNTAIAVQEKPILFSGAMVRKIIEDLKTNTRRVFKDMAANIRIVDGTPKGFLPGIPEGWVIPCPYGKPGTKLWVRETWIPVAFGSYEPICGEARRDACQIEYAAAAHSGYHTAWDHYSGKWRPSIHMPRWASRLTLEIVSVKVERVQDISEEDAKAEGCNSEITRCSHRAFQYDEDAPFHNNAREDFVCLWDSINAKREGGKYAWAANPWVWAIEFRRLDTSNKQSNSLW